MPLKISIVTPSFNQAAFIEEAISSVVEQRYPNIEYIILDAKSTDGTIEIIKKYGEMYPNQIRWKSERDNGQVDALNNGFKLATGEIIAFINADDYYQPGSFEAVNSYFENHPDKDWLIGNCGINPDGLKWTFTFKNIWPVNKIKSINYLFNFINQPAVFMRKKLVMQVGRIDIQYKFSFDYDYWLRCLEVGLPGRISRELAVFRVHKEAKSTNNYHDQFLESYAIACKYTKNKLALIIHRTFIFFVEIIYRSAKGN